LSTPSTLSHTDLFTGGGEMGALMRSTDWSKTRLGPVEHWPKSLRTMLGVVLGSRFPMLLWWGPELLHLYNDAYRPILRDKHPASLAAPAAEVWAEVWDVAGPMARSVQEGGLATWTEDLQLFINSGGMAEETYFTFSYSPVPGDDGRVGGLLNTVQETTVKVQSERQIRMLHDLAARAAEAKSVEEAYLVSAEVLSANELDLPFVLLYALNEKGGEPRLVASGGWKDPPVDAPWPFADHEVVVDDLAARFGPVPAGRWNARPERAIVVPLARARAFVVVGVSPRRALDERYRRFFRAVADQVSNVVVNACAYEAEKKRAEALAEIDRAKTTFFSNVSHEFRTPLTLILGPVEDALTRSAKSLQGDDLEAVHRSALRLLRLVNSLLDFARFEAGRLQIAFAPTDLAALTAVLAGSFRSLVEGAGLKLVVDCPPLPEPVYVDPSQWEKIVLNLVSNAFKFTLRGEIAVSLRGSGDRVDLTVRDTGCGIPAHELPRMFERFHRVEGARGRSFEGTGIGLSLVRELVKLHGGTVRVSSVEGQGSTFEVSLPTGRAHLPPDRVVSDPPPARAAGQAAPYLLEASQWAGSEQVLAPPPAASDGARVLVADDNADMRNYLDRLLSTLWRVDAVEDGEAALASARASPPDLVLTDIMMPRMNGYALLRELRADPRTSHVPVVLLSARAGEEAVLAGLETGADDYLVKPFSARELVARVRTHLDMGRLRHAWARKLEASNKDLEAFSYSVSHDLRAPLRAIVGFTKMLEGAHSKDLTGEGRRLLGVVAKSAQKMGALIDDLLEFSRSGRAALRLGPVDPAGLARDVFAELRKTCPERKVEATFGPLPPAEADPALLRQVFANLISNAVKYTRPRDVARVEVGGASAGTENIYWVKDNGVGFDPEYAHKLFGVFQRLHSESEFEGTGVGLAIVHRIVQRHGGRVWAEGKMNEGAAFYFTLPKA